jgi:hypothetical protein
MIFHKNGEYIRCSIIITITIIIVGAVVIFIIAALRNNVSRTRIFLCANVPSCQCTLKYLLFIEEFLLSIHRMYFYTLVCTRSKRVYARSQLKRTLEWKGVLFEDKER